MEARSRREEVQILMRTGDEAPGFMAEVDVPGADLLKEAMTSGGVEVALEAEQVG